MNKYELALVVNAKIEDDARAAVVEKAQGYITRFGGVVSEVEDWGKKKFSLRHPEDERRLLLLHPVRSRSLMHLLRSKKTFVLWIMFFVSYASEKTRHR